MMDRILSWCYRISGWKTVGSFPQFKKYVVAVAPHTSGWDFIIGIMARSATHISHARFLGKKELFDGPFGWIFRALGGTAVDRSGSKDLVAQTVEIFNRHETFVLAVAPEGTRKKVEKLKTGFYYIALGAGVPIIPVGFDFTDKTVVIGEPFYPTGNVESDMSLLLSFYRKIRGKVPEYGL